MPEQVAERWYATDDSELVSHVSKEELGGMLHEVVALSKQTLAHSANGDFPIKFFHTARDDNHDLREILLSAILDDCRSTQQAIRLAVQWGDAKITRMQLQESNQADPSSLRVELETALLAADYNMIKVLTTYYYYLTTYTISLLTILLLTTTAHSTQGAHRLQGGPQQGAPQPVGWTQCVPWPVRNHRLLGGHDDQSVRASGRKSCRDR